MKIVIIETEHFQYGITQLKLFEDSKSTVFCTESIKREMLSYRPEVCKGDFHIIENIESACSTIIEFCQSNAIDLLLLSPVFDSYEAILKISKQVTCKKLISIHNLNFWVNSRFRTLKSYKQRKTKLEILKNFDYIAVEDFIYAYVNSERKDLTDKYKFLYIPFTIFNKRPIKKFQKQTHHLKIVLPGYIHKERRRYEHVLAAIEYFANKQVDIIFSFAGKAVEEYGLWVINELKRLNKIKPGIAEFYPLNQEIVPDMFLKEMQTSDLVLSASTSEFKALGTTEYIGKTKPTAAIHDMMSFELPGLLPSILKVPTNLEGSVFNYKDGADLISILEKLIKNPDLLEKWKTQASHNSTFFTADQIRKNLPFFYTICKRCVMDNSNDSDIFFNNKGYCNYCTANIIETKSDSFESDYTESSLKKIIEEVKATHSNNEYDCVVGISGGVDSAFLISKLVDYGLRPIAVHFDNGWNSEIATKNIENLLKQLNVNLFTYVVDWEEFKDLQLSFLKAGVIDIELITDHAITAVLMQASIQFKTKYIFIGHNYASESILPNSWYHWKHDALNIKSIHKKFGKLKLKTFPFFTFFNEYYHVKIRKTKRILLLNYINYNKEEAKIELTEKYGWVDYGTKHNESVFTRFYQNYILPKKFKVDKRKAHYSSLICSNQVTREQALESLKTNPWESEETLKDKAYILKKFQLSESEFDVIINSKPKSHLDYASYLTRHNYYIKKIKNWFKWGQS